MWIVDRIDEADFGCEERLPGEPLMVLVTIKSDDGSVCQFECAEEWLVQQEIDEGDEWSEDIDTIDKAQEKWNQMSDWMENYFEAVEEMNN